MNTSNHHWIEWLCHTNFSFLYGASHPHEFMESAQNHNYSGVAFCDFDGVYGLARAYRFWKKMECSNKPRLFYGTEIHLSPDHDLPVIQQNTVALIARSARGYGNICRISSLMHASGKHKAHISLDALSNQNLEGISAIIPMRGLMRRNEASWFKQCESIQSMFSRDHSYMAITRLLAPSEDYWIPKSLEASRKLNFKTLLSLDPFMHERSRKNLSDTLHAIRTNLTVNESVGHFFVNDERSLQPIDTIHARFSHMSIFRESLENSISLADQCIFSFEELKYRYPKEMIPSEHTAQSYLNQLTWNHAVDVYGISLPPRVKKLLEHELQLIETLGFADYFLTVWDIVSWARKQGILCQGRGSAANSAVCFVLGITAVDPTKFDLLFERFMSVERGDPPDIDVDFENERREEVIQYIYRRYGRDRASMVANVITFRRKGSFRACGKALGISEQILSEVSSQLSDRTNAGRPTSDILNDIRTPETEPNIPWAQWISMSNLLKGFPRHLGIHSGGFMIADRSLDNLVAQEPASMADRTVIQWCKDDIEDLGFFKIDILALGMLTAVRKSLDLIASHYKEKLTLATIPQEDVSTYQMIQAADTVGTFQIESRAQMSMLPKMKPKTFYDLVIEVAIIRPGPIQGGMIHPFLRRRHGLEPVSFPDERLRPILQRTLGIPIFQEQVMRIAMAVGDFSPGEANELRKNMGAWAIRGDMNPWLEKLSSGMRKNGIAPEFAQSILDQMKGFAEYGFPESHSVSFALIAYASSYLKRHYPAAFFASLLNSQPMGFYSPHALIQAAKRSGIAVLPICAKASSWDNTLEPITGTGVPELAIRLGFRMISGFAKKSGLHIEKSRSSSPNWATFEHFLQHTQLPRHDLTSLAAANVFAIFGLSRRSALWIAAAAPHSNWLEDVETDPQLRAETISESIQQDFSHTQTSLFAHPAQYIRDESWCYSVDRSKVKRSKDIDLLIPNQIITVFGMILIQQRPPSARGMMFITLEDETGFINLALTPETIDRIRDKIAGQSFLCVSGKLQKNGDLIQS